MSQGVKSSLPTHLNRPSHLSPDNGGNEGDAQFERRHGKTRSHMVGDAQFYPKTPAILRTRFYSTAPLRPEAPATHWTFWSSQGS